MSFFNSVYEVVKTIPEGKVCSYGVVARLAGRPRAARAVGYALHVNPEPGIIPCHRVVNQQGRLAPAFAFGGSNEQKKLLEREGVSVDAEDCVDMSRYGWAGDAEGVEGWLVPRR